MTIEELRVRRAMLAQAVQANTGVRAGDPRWAQQQRDIEELRATNAELKAAHIREAAKQMLVAESVAAAVVPPAAPAPDAAIKKGLPWKAKNQTRGEFLHGQALRIRRTIRGIAKPEPFTVQFLAELNKFITAQDEHVKTWRAAELAKRANDPATWSETWTAGHHHRDDLACPECGTDSTVGCLACPA